MLESGTKSTQCGMYLKKRGALFNVSLLTTAVTEAHFYLMSIRRKTPVFPVLVLITKIYI